MSGVVTTGTFPKALKAGITEWVGLSYDQHPEEFSVLFDVRNSEDAYEEFQEAVGLGLASVKTEAGTISMGSFSQGINTKSTHVAYALGYKISREERDDNKYMRLSESRSNSLGFSMRTTKEIVHANKYNRAFNSSYTYGDGVELLSTANIDGAGGTFSNKLTVDADFSEAALEDLLIQIAGATNSAGLNIALQGKKLIGPRQLMFEFARVLESANQSGTANNDINAIKQMGALMDGYAINHYLTDADAWFVRTNLPNSMMSFNRTPLEIEFDNEGETKNLVVTAYERYSATCADKRGIFGSAGA